MEKVKQWVESQAISAPWSKIGKIVIKERLPTCENYQATFTKGKIHITAESYLAAAYAIQQLDIARKANHIGDFLGDIQPTFKLRPLWINPSILQEKHLDTYCRRTLELGYNCWIIGSYREGMFTSDPIPKWNTGAIRIITKSYGIKLIYKPQLLRTFEYAAVCPIDQTYQNELHQLLTQWIADHGECDGIFWESPCHHQGYENGRGAKELLRPDLAAMEMQVLENILKKIPLFFYIPSKDLKDAQQQSTWMLKLSNSAAKSTCIAFSAVAGGIFEDHLPPHPVWEELRKTIHPSASALMPILNCGGIDQGEGLWPTLPLDLLQNFIPRSSKFSILGFAIPAPAIPSAGGFLDASLWMAAQMQWRNLPISLLAETWFNVFHPKEPFSKHYQTLEQFRSIVKEISHIRSIAHQPSRQLIPPPDCRSRIDSTVALLKHLDTVMSISPSAHTPQKPGLREYYPFFSRDVKKILSLFAQHLGVPTPHLMQGHDQGDGFWTDLSNPEGIKRWRREHPRKGPQGSIMEQILQENRFEINE